MELGLSLGNRGVVETNNMGFCMALGLKGSSNYSSSSPSPSPSDQKLRVEQDDDEMERREKVGSTSSSLSPPPPPPRRLQLDLLPLSPVPPPSQPPPPLRFPWLADNISTEPGSFDGPGTIRTMDVNRRPTVVEEQSSPNSGTSSFMEFTLYNNGGVGGINGENGNNYGQLEVVMMGVTTTTTTSRGSDHDDEENIGSARKKLRLSKEQSAFLEESFKEHHTLNPKQKLALANQLNLRPRQVEVWFQNRRARTKLKQTEVDCEYLKRCCETLTEDNRRLQKELQELRALKSSQPFFMHLPATTLTMCPSCERVTPTSTSASVSVTTVATATGTVAVKHATVGAGSVTLSLGKPKPMLPFSNAQDRASP